MLFDVLGARTILWSEKNSCAVTHSWQGGAGGRGAEGGGVGSSLTPSESFHPAILNFAAINRS